MSQIDVAVGRYHTARQWCEERAAEEEEEQWQARVAAGQATKEEKEARLNKKKKKKKEVSLTAEDLVLLSCYVVSKTDVDSLSGLGSMGYLLSDYFEACLTVPVLTK